MASDSGTLIPGWPLRPPGLDQNRHSDPQLYVLPVFPDHTSASPTCNSDLRAMMTTKAATLPKGHPQNLPPSGKKESCAAVASAPLTYSRTWLLQFPSHGPFPSVAKAPYSLLNKQDKTNKDLHFWEDGVDILFPISPTGYN